MPGVEGKHPGIQFRKAASAPGAGTADREQRRFIRFIGIEYDHPAGAEVQRLHEKGQQRPLGLGYDGEIAYRQLDVVFPETVEPRPGGRRQSLAVDAQVVEPLAGGPLGKVGVVALSRDDHRAEQLDSTVPVPGKQLSKDRGGALGIDGNPAVRTVLHSELDEQQAQKMMNLRQGGDGALASAAAGALFDRHGRGNAEDRIHVRAAGRLDELARVGVEGFQVAALPLCEQDVEGDRALAAAAHAGDDREPVAR